MGRKAVAIGVVIALLVVVAAGLAVYFTVFADDDENKNNENTVTDAPAARMLVKGQWADWDPWSTCSATCGGGTQNRYRHCNDPAPENGGADCVGKSLENRPCAGCDCPACGRQCSSSGILVNCSLCECLGDVTEGKVTVTGNSLPLADVDVYVIGHEWESLASTNRMGEFRLEDLCIADIVMRFAKTGYLSEKETYNPLPGGVLGVKMAELRKPVFTVHPQSQAMFAGDMIFLRCEATGTPEPSVYEWFKDGDMIEYTIEDDKSNILKIDNVQVHHQGAYACRATSPAGKKFSKAAKVIVQGSGDDTCSSKPTTKMVSLPPTCSLASTGATHVDVGRCSGDTCTLRGDDQVVTNKRCCSPTDTQTIVAQCEGFEYSLRKVTSCGCSECQEEYDEVTVDVILTTLVDGRQEQVRDSLLLDINGQSVWTTGGAFTWAGTPSDDSITIRYEPGRYDLYLGTVSVVHITPGVTEYKLPIMLTPRPEPTVVDASQGADLQVGDAAAKINIPPGSIVDGNGNRVTGNVNVYASFSDPRVEGGLASAPGEFTFEDEEGETRGLQTFGVIGLQAWTSSGQRAYISGKTDFVIDSVSLAIPENSEGNPDALLWTLDPVTGKWEESGPLASDEGTTRKKRQAQIGATGSSEFPTNIPYINIDKPLLRGRQCYVSVYIYSSRNMTEGFAGQSVTIYTKDITGTMYIGQTKGYSGYDGKVCLPLPCGLKHELVVYSGYGPIASTTHYLPVPPGFVFENTHNDSRVAFTSPSIDDVIDGSGPVHRYAFNTCPNSTTEDYHFQFYLKDVPKPGRLDAVELRPNKTLSWYAGTTSSNRTACMIRVEVLTEDPSEIQLIGQSYQDDVDGDLYGTYITGIRQRMSYWGAGIIDGNFAGCIQVKCPGRIYDEEEEQLVDDVHTYVKVNLATRNNSQCVLDYTNAEPEYYNSGDVIAAVNFDDITNSSLGLDIQELSYNYEGIEGGGTGARSNRLYYYNNGLYRATGSYDTASRRALLQCLSPYANSGIVARFDCADGKYKSYTGSGVRKRSAIQPRGAF